MPRMDYRLKLEEHLAPQERRLVRIMLLMLNDVRTQLGLQGLTEDDIARLWREQLQQDAATRKES